MPIHIPSQGAMGAAVKIETALARYPRSGWDEKDAWDQAEAALQRLILDEGGSYKADWLGGSVRLWGFRATSTMGLRAACQNWVTQVRSKAQPGSGETA